jgi:SsrA-binding protein
MATGKKTARVSDSTIAENRRARFDYEIAGTYEAGIELLGGEVKSAKNGQLQIAGARVLLRGGGERRANKNSRHPGAADPRTPEAYLVNSHIPPYQPKNTPAGYEEDRARRLLLTRGEIKELIGALGEKGRMLIPLRAFLKNGYIKIELGLARPKKKSDKREALKKRAHGREMRAGEEE